MASRYEPCRLCGLLPRNEDADHLFLPNLVILTGVDGSKRIMNVHVVAMQLLSSCSRSYRKQNRVIELGLGDRLLELLAKPAFVVGRKEVVAYVAEMVISGIISVKVFNLPTRPITHLIREGSIRVSKACRS